MTQASTAKKFDAEKYIRQHGAGGYSKSQIATRRKNDHTGTSVPRIPGL